jgi:hypothetical protein
VPGQASRWQKQRIDKDDHRGPVFDDANDLDVELPVRPQSSDVDPRGLPGNPSTARMVTAGTPTAARTCASVQFPQGSRFEWLRNLSIPRSPLCSGRRLSAHLGMNE